MIETYFLTHNILYLHTIHKWTYIHLCLCMYKYVSLWTYICRFATPHIICSAVYTIICIIMKEMKYFSVNLVLWHLLPFHLATLTSCIGVSVNIRTLSFSLSPKSCSTYWNVYVWCVCMHICMNVQRAARLRSRRFPVTCLFYSELVVGALWLRLPRTSGSPANRETKL